MPPPANVMARVLVVEDDPDIARLLADLLADHGFSATVAGSGTAMDKLLQDAHFDLILLDVMLPGEDGLGICRRLRGQSSTPIIMVTSLGEDIDRILGVEIGADDYITKPFNSRELLARVKALLRRATHASRSGFGLGLSPCTRRFGAMVEP